MSILSAALAVWGWAVAASFLLAALLSFIALRRTTAWLASQERTEEAMKKLGGHPLGIRELQVRAYYGAKAKGWHDTPVPAPTRLMLMVTELAEAMEEYRKGHSPRHIYHTAEGKPEGIPMELADVVIRILDFAGVEGIDLEEAILEKLAYNATRSHRHGGKVA